MSSQGPAIIIIIIYIEIYKNTYINTQKMKLGMKFSKFKTLLILFVTCKISYNYCSISIHHYNINHGIAYITATVTCEEPTVCRYIQ